MENAIVNLIRQYNPHHFYLVLGTPGDNMNALTWELSACDHQGKAQTKWNGKLFQTSLTSYVNKFFDYLTHPVANLHVQMIPSPIIVLEPTTELPYRVEISSPNMPVKTMLKLLTADMSLKKRCHLVNELLRIEIYLSKVNEGATVYPTKTVPVASEVAATPVKSEEKSTDSITPHIDTDIATSIICSGNVGKGSSGDDYVDDYTLDKTAQQAEEYVHQIIEKQQHAKSLTPDEIKAQEDEKHKEELEDRERARAAISETMDILKSRLEKEPVTKSDTDRPVKQIIVNGVAHTVPANLSANNPFAKKKQPNVDTKVEPKTDALPAVQMADSDFEADDE